MTASAALSERARDIVRDDPALAAEIARQVNFPVAVGLTFRQRQVLEVIEEFIHDHDGVSPSYDEIAKAMGGIARGNIHRILKALEERGHIRVLPNRRRSITVISSPCSVAAQPDHIAGESGS